MADLSDWLTKQQVSDALSVSEKTIERYVKGKKLRTKTRREKGQRPVLVYDPAMVQQLLSERDDSTDGDIIDIPAAPAAIERTVKAPASSLPPQLAMLVAALETSKTNTVAINQKLFLTIHEAALLSGLPESYIRRLIAEKKLQAFKAGSGWRILREALETLAPQIASQTL